MSQELFTTNITIPLMAAVGTLGGPSSDIIPIMRIPGTAYGGGMTIVRWDYATNKAIAVGSAPAVKLVTLNSSSLPIGTVCTNGSAATTAGTAVAGSITTAWIAGTVGFLGCSYTQATYGGTSPVYMHLSIQWYPGRGSA